MNAKTVLGLLVHNPVSTAIFVPVVFAQLQGTELALSQALPSGTSRSASSSPRGGLGRKGRVLGQNSAQKAIPLPHYLEIVGSIIISQFALQIFS